MAEVYKQPQSVPVGKNNGYPNKVKSTQTMKTRGAGAATSGNKHNPSDCIELPFTMTIGNINSDNTD